MHRRLLGKGQLEVVTDFSKAKSLNGERVRFEVAGGDYRMVVAFDWKRSIAFIKFVGTQMDATATPPASRGSYRKRAVCAKPAA